MSTDTSAAPIFRLSWEMVSVSLLHLYCNADPRWNRDTYQTVPNSQIPDMHWHQMSVETLDPWDQARTLAEWAANDVEFVRNVKLERRSVEPSWTPVAL